MTSDNKNFNCVPVFQYWVEPNFKQFFILSIIMVFVGIPVMGLVMGLFLGLAAGFIITVGAVSIVLFFFFLNLLHKRRVDYKIYQKCSVCDYVSSSWPPELLKKDWEREKLRNSYAGFDITKTKDCSFDEYLEKHDKRGQCSKCGAVEGEAFKPKTDS